jgi:hypothetical protein
MVISLTRIMRSSALGERSKHHLSCHVYLDDYDHYSIIYIHIMYGKCIYTILNVCYIQIICGKHVMLCGCGSICVSNLLSRQHNSDSVRNCHCSVQGMATLLSGTSWMRHG